jgi:hypothetical protein
VSKPREVPFHARGKSIRIRITSIGLIGTVDPTSPALNFSVKLGASAPTPYSLGVGSGPGDLSSQGKEFKKPLDDVVISGKTADAARVRDLLLLFHYELTE